MAQRESKRQRLADEDVQNLQENNIKSEMKVVKSLLNWCFENTKIHKLKGKGSDSKKDNLLHWACEEGHLEIVEHLLEEIKNRFGDINCLGFDDETPLHKATKNGQKEVVKFLVDKAANLEAKNAQDLMPIHLLTEPVENAVEIVNIFIEKGADLNCRNSNDDTPLHLVLQNAMNSKYVKVEEKCLEIAKVLIENGANIDAINDTNETPLHIVSDRADNVKNTNWFQVKVTKLLLEKGANTTLKDNYNSRTPLHIALQTSNIEVAKLLISSKDADLNLVDGFEETPLQCAIRNNDLEMAKILHAKGAWSKKHLGEHFYEAAANGQLELVELLISFKYGDTLVNCQYFGNTNTPLHIAVKNCENVSTGHCDVVKYLLENGALVNLKNENDKNRPLHYAKCKEVAELLLKNGAQTDCKNKKGQTPKETSIENKAFDVTEIIIKYETRAEEKARLAEENSCDICFEPRNGTFAFLPCGHAKTCENCCQDILQNANQNPLCPTCRQPVTTYQKIFI